MRIFRQGLFTGIFLLALISCDQKRSDSGDRVEEIHSSDIQELIRNPVSADKPLDTSLMARIEMSELIFHFDTVKEGAIVEHTFGFRNVGKTPLIISNAQSTCGCTVPQWPKEPIKSGGKGEIKVRFNTEDRFGSQNKAITIFANSYPQQTVVRLVGFVQKLE